MKLFVGIFLHFRRFRRSRKIVVRTLFRLTVPPSRWHPTSEYFDGNRNGIVLNECIFHVSMSAFSSLAFFNKHSRFVTTSFEIRTISKINNRVYFYIHFLFNFHAESFSTFFNGNDMEE